MIAPNQYITKVLYFQFLFTAKPRGGPHIQGIEQDLKIGDTINLNCTSLKSKPAANLTFYINGRNVS